MRLHRAPQRPAACAATRRRHARARPASIAIAVGVGFAVAALAVAPRAVLAASEAAAEAPSPQRDGAAEASARADAPHIAVELLAEDLAIEPGRDAMLGVRFVLEDEWHVYWHNPGDSGLAPRIDWSLPAGMRAGDVEWPAPERIAVGPLVDYGYSHEVLLPVALQAAPDLPSGEARIAARVEWLVCKVDCIPGKADLALSLPVAPGAPARDPRHAAAFAAARARLPRPAPRGALAATADESVIVLRATGAAAAALAPPREVAFYPGTPGLIENAAPQERIDAAGAVELVLRRSQQPHVLPARLAGVIVAGEASAHGSATTVLAVDAPLAAAPTTAAGAATGAAAAPAAEAAPAAPPAALPLALALAFAGGLLLNLMPCVFPVLSLKIADFARQASGDARALRRHGWAYAGGIVLSFWVLAGALLGLRAAGHEIGWGFQLQSPGFVAAMAILLFALALAMLGVFQIGVGLTGVAGRFATGDGVGASFWTGVVATLLATPCTAPFMGTAIGAALALPWIAGLAVFSALAVGMAAPYVALSFAPALVARLPRPGPWMEALQQWLAFPLLATVVWLAWVRAEQGPPGAVAALLAALLLVGMAAWLVGRAQRDPAARLGLQRTVAAIAAVAGIAVALAAPNGSVPGDAASAPGPGHAAAGDPWQAFSPTRLTALRDAGTPVFIDFTAAWCLTCQVNERLVLATEEVQRGFADRGVALLRADWTSRDADVTRALESFGRSGVPLYVLYPGAAGATPEVLPALLTPGLVLEALDRLGGRDGIALAPPSRGEAID